MVNALNSILLSSSTRPVASQLSFSNTVEVSVGIPELADVSRSDTISVSLTNTVGKMYRFLFLFSEPLQTHFEGFLQQQPTRLLKASPFTLPSAKPAH
jgi:hypothetical protein